MKFEAKHSNFLHAKFFFPQSHIHSILGYTTFYAQLICFFRLCNNINDFLFRGKLSYSKLVKCGYMHSLLFKYFRRFCLAYKIEEKYGEKNYNLLFSRMIKYNPSVSCDVNNVMGINTIVKTCSVKITAILGICHLSSAVWFRTQFINQLYQLCEGNTFSFKTRLVPSLLCFLVLMPWFFALSWWHHQMETFSGLLAHCVGNSLVTVNSPHKGQ